MADDQKRDVEAQAAQLAAEVREATASNRGQRAAPKGRGLLAAGVFGAAVLGVGGLYFANSGDAPPPAPEIANPDTFQTGGEAFGSLERPKPERVVVQDTAEAEALRAELEKMRAELEALKNAPAPVAEDKGPDPAVEAQMAAMASQVESLAAALKAAQEAQQRALDEKDLELARMQAALDAATLQAPVPAEDGSAAAAAAARRAEAEALYQRRAGSGMIAFGGQGGSGEPAAGEASAEGRKLSANEEFAREGGAAAKVERAKIIANPSNTIVQGTMIAASLETFINSDLPGQIRAVVSDDVHSFDGSRILIPRGSKVVGQYSSNVEVGQRRAMVVWTRIIMPDNQTVEISSIGGDGIGQSGLKGKVDTHFLSRFGSAALISLIAAAPEQIQGGNSVSDGSSDLGTSLATGVATMTASTMEKVLSRPPTITVNQGAIVTIMVDRDLEIY